MTVALPVVIFIFFFMPCYLVWKLVDVIDKYFISFVYSCGLRSLRDISSHFLIK